MMSGGGSNIDHKTVNSFGEEWSHFDQSGVDSQEWDKNFEIYFGIFPWDKVNDNSHGFDMGCGSGRWAKGVAHRVGRLNCIDPSPKALDVARKNLSLHNNVSFHEASVDRVELAPESQDFGYSLGVLHHIPDTPAALKSCTKLLKPGACLLYTSPSPRDRG